MSDATRRRPWVAVVVGVVTATCLYASTYLALRMSSFLVLHAHIGGRDDGRWEIHRAFDAESDPAEDVMRFTPRPDPQRLTSVFTPLRWAEARWRNRTPAWPPTSDPEDVRTTDTVRER